MASARAVAAPAACGEVVPELLAVLVVTTTAVFVVVGATAVVRVVAGEVTGPTAVGWTAPEVVDRELVDEGKVDVGLVLEDEDEVDVGRVLEDEDEVEVGRVLEDEDEVDVGRVLEDEDEVDVGLVLEDEVVVGRVVAEDVVIVRGGATVADVDTLETDVLGRAKPRREAHAATNSFCLDVSMLYNIFTQVALLQGDNRVIINFGSHSTEYLRCYSNNHWQDCSTARNYSILDR
jgi:hypothetical protein